MSLTINTNIQSMNAQRNLNKTQSNLSKSLERLSSGLRINSAKDDAAGLGISTRMTAQIRGLNQAVRNANDAISFAQTAEGAMSEVGDLLQRMREISVQASNDTNSASDRMSLQKEMDQLYSEIDRIASSTQFNGVNLLDGTATNKTFQVGANQGQTIAFSINSVTTNSLNLNGYSALGELNGGRVTLGAGSASGDLNINGVSITTASAAKAGVYANGEASSRAVAINAHTAQTGVTATAYNAVKGNGNVSGIVSGLTIQSGAGAAVTISDSGSMEELVDNINRDAAGVTATLNSSGGITLSNDTGNAIVVSGTTTNSGLTSGTYQGYLSLTSVDNSAITISTSNTDADLHEFGFNESTGSSNLTGTAVSANAVAATDLVTINGVVIGASSSSSAGDKAAAINSVSTQTGVKASARTTVTGTGGTGHVEGTGTAGVTINGVDLVTANAGAAITSMATLVDVINTGVQGVHAEVDGTGNLILTSESGLTIDLVIDAGAGTNVNIGLSDSTNFGELTLTSETGTDIVIGSNASTQAAQVAALVKLGLAEQGGSSEAIGRGLSVETQANAENAISRIDDALASIAESRGSLGAVQNRVESTISNLQNVAENLSAANSRIVDADFAAETAALTKNQILQQAGAAMLAQANQLPQVILSLLQG